MPYIKQSQREKFPKELLNEIANLLRNVMNIPTYVGEPNLFEGANAIKLLIDSALGRIPGVTFTLPTKKEFLHEKMLELAKLINNQLESYAGELNYLITTILLKAYNSENYKLRYYEWNDIVGILRQVELLYTNMSPTSHMQVTILGMLECCKMEMYRRKVAPYEDEKIIENGDV